MPLHCGIRETPFAHSFRDRRPKRVPATYSALQLQSQDLCYLHVCCVGRCRLADCGPMARRGAQPYEASNYAARILRRQRRGRRWQSCTGCRLQQPRPATPLCRADSCRGAEAQHGSTNKWAICNLARTSIADEKLTLLLFATGTPQKRLDILALSTCNACMVSCSVPTLVKPGEELG